MGVLPVILAEPAAPRCRVAARRRWGEGTRGWGGDGRRGLQNINATIGFNSSQASMGSEASIHSALLRRKLASDQGEEGLEPGSVAIAGIEEDSGGKQSASILASSCLPLAFSCLSCSVSLSSCFIRCSCSTMLCS